MFEIGEGIAKFDIFRAEKKMQMSLKVTECPYIFACVVEFTIHQPILVFLRLTVLARNTF